MDLQLTDNDLTFAEGDVEIITGVRQVAQNVAARLQTFRTEWFLDTFFGPNYIRDVFKKNPSLTLVRAILVQQIEESIKDAALNTVVVLKDFELTLESETRILQVNFVLRDEATQKEAEEQVVIG